MFSLKSSVQLRVVVFVKSNAAILCSTHCSSSATIELGVSNSNAEMLEKYCGSELQPTSPIVSQTRMSVYQQSIRTPVGNGFSACYKLSRNALIWCPKDSDTNC